MKSTLTHAWVSEKSLVPSRPAIRMSSFSPPGWKAMYGVMLYTLPLIAAHASSRLLCSRSTEGGIRARDVVPPRRSVPELFSAAQSSGLCPGARATFSRFLVLDSCVGGFVVVGGGIREDAEDGVGGPGLRGAGSGGGGIRVDGAVSCAEDEEGAEDMR